MRNSKLIFSGRRLAFITVVASAVALGLSASAGAEKPGWYSNPGLSGPAQVGATLVGHLGGLLCTPNCQGTAYEWLVCTGAGAAGADRPPGGLAFDGQPCPGAATLVPFPGSGDPVLVVPPAASGKHIQLHIIATNIDCGEVRQDGTQECNSSTGHAYTNTVGPITGQAAPVAPALPPAVLPLNTAPPAILGNVEEGQVLTANNGTWTGTDPIAYTYVWNRCSKQNNGCKAIDGATRPTYTLVGDDVGARINVTVSATNRAGGRAFTSKLTRRVLPTKPRPGYLVLAAADLRDEHQLVVVDVRAPLAVRSGGSATLVVRVGDKRGFLIRGADVEVSEAAGRVEPVTAVSRPTGNAIVRLKFGRLARNSKLVLAIKVSDPDGEAAVAVRRLTLVTA